MNDLVDVSAPRIVCYADERSRLLEILRYIAGHAGMACRHANALGCRSSLENVERAALEAIAMIACESAERRLSTNQTQQLRRRP